MKKNAFFSLLLGAVAVAVLTFGQISFGKSTDTSGIEQKFQHPSNTVDASNWQETGRGTWCTNLP